MIAPFKQIVGLLITALIIGAFWYSPLSARLNGLVLDAQFHALRDLSPTKSPDNIVIVGIDEQTYETFDRPSGLWHSYVGDLLLAVAEAKPKLVVMDLVFEKLYRNLIANHYVSLHRGLLAFRKSQTPLVMAIALKNSTAPSAFDKTNSSVTLQEVFPYPAMQAILKGEQYYGLALVEKDVDGVLRRQSMDYPNCSDCSPSMLARVYQQLGENHSHGLINFSLGSKFEYVPLHQVVQWYRDGDRDQLAETFSGKAIFVGTVARFEDRHLAPIALGAWEGNNLQTPGVLFMAQAMRSIDAGGLIQPTSIWLTLVLLILAMGLWFSARSLRIGIATLVLFVMGLMVLSTWLLTARQELPAGLILMAAIMTSGIRFSFEAWYSFLERKRLTSSFGGYVSPNVMKEILDGNISPDMQGTRLNVCVMFADIRNFTTRSEGSTPESIIQLLNYYFEEMTAAIDEFGGTVDKFIGDGLMVFFGAPNLSANPSQNGFDAAKSMLSRLEKINQTLIEQGVEPIEIGIGLHTGEAVIGHVGSARRNEYTAIGDTVNVAARIEGLTKALKCTLVCSEVVFNDVSDRLQLTALGHHKLKGHTPVPVYGWNPEQNT
ncbi:MAG: class 3 adenylate cyclase/CHASE2 domain-containing sensor protein [Arenicella sp.]